MGSLDSSISSGLSFVSDFPRGFALRDLGKKRIHFRLFVTLIGSKSDELAIGESCLTPPLSVFILATIQLLATPGDDFVQGVIKTLW